MGITPEQAIQGAMDSMAQRKATGREAGYEDVALPGDEVEVTGDGSGETLPVALGDGGDPGDYNVPDVVAYLNGLDQDTEEGLAEFERVVAAEQSGQARKGIIGGD